MSRAGAAVRSDALLRRAERAVQRARRAGAPVLLGHTERAAAASTRARSSSPRARPGEDWFCFEQPDRDGAALAALGTVDAAAGHAGPSASTGWRATGAR